MDGGPEGQRREVLEAWKNQASESTEKIDPNSPDVLSMTGRWEISKGNYEVAIRAFKRALDIDPGHLQSLVRYAFALNESGHELEKAEHLWREVIRQDPMRHAAHEDPAINENTFERIVRHAWLLIKADRQEQAQHLLEQSLEFAEQFCDENASDHHNDPAYGVCSWTRWKLHALLQQRDETLEGLRQLIVEDKVLWRFDTGYFSSLDFMQDDPEFQRLFQIIIDANNADMDLVREMERSGEIPPAPWKIAPS